MLARVFSEDPMFRYLFPPGEKQLGQLELALGFLMRLVLVSGEAVRIGSDPDGVIAYYPPGEFPPSTGRVLIEIVRAIPHAIPRWIPIAKVFSNLRIMSQLEKKHPAERHWYISIIAVNPAAQGRGLGGRLLEPLEARADAAQEALYLESTNPKNLTFYERHGFRCIEEFQPLKGSPVVWRMLRKPR
jgi:ribosomal protein S18 acetylase RimI-like enzyme